VVVAFVVPVADRDADHEVLVEAGDPPTAGT
jgi:hypothetical protein